MQRNTLDRFTTTVVVVPITSNLRRAKIPGTIVIPAGEGGLTQESVALCYQIVVIDKQRLIRQLGTLSASYLLKLKEALEYTLELDETENENAESSGYTNTIAISSSPALKSQKARSHPHPHNRTDISTSKIFSPSSQPIKACKLEI